MVISSLISSKEFILLSSHLNNAYLFNKALISLNFSAKFGINLLIKLILPKNDCNDFLLVGGGIFLIHSILS
jgi:hypothetical protein